MTLSFVATVSVTSTAKKLPISRESTVHRTVGQDLYDYRAGVARALLGMLKDWGWPRLRRSGARWSCMFCSWKTSSSTESWASCGSGADALGHVVLMAVVCLAILSWNAPPSTAALLGCHECKLPGDACAVPVRRVDALRRLRRSDWCLFVVQLRHPSAAHGRSNRRRICTLALYSGLSRSWEARPSTSCQGSTTPTSVRVSL